MVVLKKTLTRTVRGKLYAKTKWRGRLNSAAGFYPDKTQCAEKIMFLYKSHGAHFFVSSKTRRYG
ncbi:MAG: hypothetical protein A3D67_01010 [Candidatus Lloydbacteria bacterium RIFCSPHIGHO2_02_FULL_51_22]|uniref:Uncharacterized protein n=2 Tax=Candidatus Lloydiibacteriota TaxID=1817910 RepID=A0A1G2D7W5_9BACT|nr:MAG: hypothetical protein A3D67_01010 [Candidatus Lloydbacteria bacterium RIFCSPHIGHO2_02_FULL_51_22]OGZ15032.1 MAG: hypothetical protein A3J08_01650 [Candidatus Lloydbacteria bacterium RIFCSPLOWO2_02_FULL_51_11]